MKEQIHASMSGLTEQQAALGIFVAVAVLAFTGWFATRRRTPEVPASVQQLLREDRTLLEGIATRTDRRMLRCESVWIYPAANDPRCVHITFNNQVVPLTISWMPMNVEQFINDASRMLTEQRWLVTITDGADGFMAAPPSAATHTPAAHANAA